MRTVIAAAASLALVIAPLEAGAITACGAGVPNANIPQTTPTGAFTDNGDGTVTHSLTGLMWKKCAQGASGTSCATGSATVMTWTAALAAAVVDTTAGHSDWRVPNAKELASIVENCGWGPAINLAVFPATPFGTFQTSTTWAATPTLQWTVSFNTGALMPEFKTDTYYVRLVRGGQPPDSFDAATTPPAFLDIDASVTDTKYDALTDGLILIRYLFGLSGASITNNALGTTATRTDPAAIASYLTGLGTVLDVDGNGSVDALTDGLMILRYLFGLRGNALIAGAIGTGATRTTSAAIETYILTLMP